MPVANINRSSAPSSASSYAHAPSLTSALTPVGSRELRHTQATADLRHHPFPGLADSQLSPVTAADRLAAARRLEDEALDTRRTEAGGPLPLFAGVVVYVNGSTHPHVSDHKLKQLLAEHGGRMSMHLGRRKVTHVILGRPSASSLSSGGGNAGGGAGGGLAGGKLQREIQKVGGCAVKYVGVEWVLESIKAGKRLPEARFGNLKVAASRQQSVYGLCSKSASTST
ncbi:hypothetical protein Micbo1qcDRAFT_163776, partial [Microdochium bolleyi]